MARLGPGTRDDHAERLQTQLRPHNEAPAQLVSDGAPDLGADEDRRDGEEEAVEERTSLNKRLRTNGIGRPAPYGNCRRLTSLVKNLASSPVQRVVVDAFRGAGSAVDSPLCVPRFTFSAFRRLGAAVPSVAELARDARLLLPVDAPNPWALPTTTDPDRVGMSRESALQWISSLAADRLPEHCVAAIPLSQIPYQMYYEYLDAISGARTAVGLAYDFAALVHQGAISRHVSLIDTFSDQEVTFSDEAMSAILGTNTVRWALVTNAASRVDDGFWILAPTTVLDRANNLFCVRSPVLFPPQKGGASDHPAE